MTTGKVKISNPEFVIEQIGRGYSSVSDAFKEYTTNAVDAIIQDPNLKKGSIDIIVNKNQRWALIQDNGIGMNYQKLSNVMERIGDSVKRYDKQSRGEKGLGNLAFMTFADNLTFVSKSGDDESNLVNLLRLDSSLNYYVNPLRPEDLGLPEIVKELTSRISHGTIVYFKDLDERILEKNFLPSKLEMLMSEMYTPILKSDKISIKISYIGKDSKIKSVEPGPLDFGDEPYLDTSIEVADVRLKDSKIGKGKIDFFIVINPQGSNDKIRVYHRGIKVSGDLSCVNLLDKQEPWNSGKLRGYIDDDFLTLNLPRNSFEFNENFKLWLPKIEEMGEFLGVELKKYRSKKDKEAYEIADKVIGAIDVIYKQLELSKFFAKKRKPKKEGGKEEEPETPEEPGTPEPPSSPRGPRRTLPFRPDFDGFGLDEASLRSKVVGKFIKINTNHPDYKKYYEGKDELDGADYLLDLMSKEIGFVAAKNLLTENEDERLSVDEVVRKTKEIASNIYYGAQKQLELNITGKLK
jgi:hypothetical protein